MVEVVAANLPVEAPDWSAISDDIDCPLCQYNLRGLIEPRCPECGFRFAWWEVLSPSARRHKFLFEHHPERNISSFFKTLWASLRPREFWTSLHPFQRIGVGRLKLYALLTVLPCLVGATLMGWYVHTQSWRWTTRGFDLKDLLEFIFTEWGVYVVLLPLSWPWLMFGALMIFQISMQRARVDRRHVLRCVVYSHDSFFWLGLAAIVLAGMSVFTGSDNEDLLPVLLILWGMTLAMGALSLYFAYKLYLRFDRPGWTVLSALVITVLVELNAYLAITFW